MRRLIADIGGTNARFALLAEDGEPVDEQSLRTAAFPGPVEAALAYLGGRRVEEAVLAVATPVESDLVHFTNSPWTFRCSALPEALGIRRVAVINDFVAQALAIPVLGPDDLDLLRPGEAARGRAIGVIGPGTGLGVSALVPSRQGWLALPTEGGHASLAPGSARELALLEQMMRTYGHVSKERAISGPGLLTIATALAAIDGTELGPRTPEEVAGAARGGDPVCLEAIRVLSGLLGSAAADLALTYGARGGVYIAGGVCLALGDLFDRAGFCARFVDKGRFRDYLDAIPVHLVLRRDTGLLGAAHHVIDD